MRANYVAATLMLLISSLCSGQQPQTPTAGKTRIVLLGTGTPGPDPDRSGPATAIVVNDTAYLVDFGPGVVRRASAAFRDKGIAALEPTKLRVAFVTHLHSDHTVGYPDLKHMTVHILEAFRIDFHLLELSNMLGTQQKGRRLNPPPSSM